MSKLLRKATKLLVATLFVSTIAFSGVSIVSAADTTTPAPASSASAPAAAASTQGAAIAKGNPAQQGSACGINIGCWFTDGLINILAWIAFWLMSLSGYLLGLIGLLFDWSVVVTIFQFGTFFGNSTGLLLAWGILRDIGNILILFGFIYAGITMILDLHSFDARRTIPRLIIFAVLLNFSLFTAEAIIDVGNVLSASLYQQAGTSVYATCTGNIANCSNSGSQKVGIASVLIQDTYVGSSLNASGPTFVTSPSSTGVPDNAAPLNKLLAYVGTTILITILMMALLAATVILITRSVALVIVLIVSPLGFAGMAIPQLEGMAKKWWDTLLSNAFFAPVFLLILFIGLKVMEGLTSSLHSGSTPMPTLAAALASPSTNVGTVFIIFALVIGFFVAALAFAKTSGAAGATFATSYAQKTVMSGWRAVGTVGRESYGLVARSTVGKYVPRAGDRYNKVIGDLSHRGGLTGWAAKNFDYMAGDTIAGSMKSFGTKKFAGTRSYEEDKKHREHRDHETHEAYDGSVQKKNLVEARAMPRGANVNDPVEQDRNKKITDALAKMKKETRDEAIKAAAKESDAALDDILRNLKQSEYDAIVKDDHYDAGIKKTVTERRFHRDNAPRVLQMMTPEEVAKLSDSTLTKPEVLSNIQGRQLAAIDPNNLDSASRAAIVTYVRANRADRRIDHFLKLIGQNPGGPANLVNNNMKNRWSGVNF